MKLREIRESKHIGLNELARESDINPTYLSQIERGVKTNPSRGVMERISKALESPVSELFFETSEVSENG